MNEKLKLKIIGVIIALIMIIFFVLTWFNRDLLSARLTSEAQTYGLMIIFVLTALSDIIPQYIGPHFILLQGALLNFSLPALLGTMLAGTAIGTLAGYEIGKRYGLRIALSYYDLIKVEKIEERISSHGRWVILIAALSPLPYLPIVFGSLGMRKKHVLLYGLLPRCVSLVVLALFFV